MPQSYASQFVLDTGSPDGLTVVCDHVLDWVRSAQKGNGIRIDPQAGDYDLGPLGTAVITADAFASAKTWSLVWDRPDAAGREIVWRSEVRLATLGTDVEATVAVRIVSQKRVVVPERAHVNRPRLISFLASKYKASVGGQRIDVEPTRILGNSVLHFHQDTLRSPERVLPVVVVSPFNRFAGYAIDAKTLADRIAAIAEVAIIDNPRVAWEFARIVGRPFACFDGAVRVFWPGFDPRSDDPYSHRLWLAHRIEDPRRFADRLFGQLSSYAARLVRDGPIWIAASKRTTEGRLVELRERGARVEEATQLAELANEILDGSQKILEETERERDSLREENRDLRARVEQLSLAVRYTGSDDDESDSDDVAVSDVAAAVVRADDEFDSLRFLSLAYDSAEASLYQRPDEVFEACRVLDELSSARSSVDSLGSSLEEWFLQHNVTYSRFQSQTTMGKFRDEYTFPEGEHIWEMQEHLIFGKTGRDPRHSLRVYFAWDDEEKQHVIGWVGTHRRNTKT